MPKDVSNHNRPWSGFLTHENVKAVADRLFALLASARITVVETRALGGRLAQGYLPEPTIYHNEYLRADRWLDKGQPGTTILGEGLLHVRDKTGDGTSSIMFSLADHLFILTTRAEDHAAATRCRWESTYLKFARDRGDVFTVVIEEEDSSGGMSGRTFLLVDRDPAVDQEYYRPARLGGGGGV